MESEKFIGIKEAAEFLCITENWLRKLILKKKVPYYKPLGRIYFKKSDLVDFINSAKVKVIVQK